MLKNSNLELRDVASSTLSKKLSRNRSFHFRYLELCRAKNLAPLTEIRCKNNVTSVLDFFGDKFNVNEWLLIIESLHYDQVLQTLAIRMRKNFGTVLEHLDTEKKAKLFRQKSVLFTKFIFSGVVKAVSNCIEFNKNLRVLNLEGLPLNDKYVQSVAKALSVNDSIREVSFQRSNIGDDGCEAICCTIKYLSNIEKLDLSECELTIRGAEYVAEMIKIQKISRYTEGWQKSLRYREVDPETIPGLRSIALSRNPQIGDDGIRPILEVLKEDAWIKFIEMENCGLTNRAANLILDCLKINNYILDFNVNGNAGISKFLLRIIHEQLGKEDEDQKLLESAEGLVPGPNGTLIKRKKVTLSALKEQVKTLEKQLAFERLLRKKSEQLHEKLNQQIMAYEQRLEDNIKATIPEGYVMVKHESLESIIKERNDFQRLAAANSGNTTPRNNNITLAEKLSNPMVVPLNCPNNLNLLTNRSEHSHNLKVRKAKSEMKYVEPVPKSTTRSKNAESKSDHEFNEAGITTIHFETNIGDTIENNNKNKVFNGKFSSKSPERIIIEDLSITTTRSFTSETTSDDSDTLRNEIDNCLPFNVFIRRSKQPIPLTPIPKTNDCILKNHDQKVKSPRSMFLGLSDD